MLQAILFQVLFIYFLPRLEISVAKAELLYSFFTKKQIYDYIFINIKDISIGKEIISRLKRFK